MNNFQISEVGYAWMDALRTMRDLGKKAWEDHGLVDDPQTPTSTLWVDLSDELIEQLHGAYWEGYHADDAAIDAILRSEP